MKATPKERLQSLEVRVAKARAGATMQAKPAVPSLSSIPIPKIVPTAFSARWNDELTAGYAAGSSQEQPTYIPSSPPLSQAVPTLATSSTLAHLSQSEPRTPLRVSGDEDARSSSQPPTEHRNNARQNEMQRRGLTSSVVKGEAANGLLELMRGSTARSGGAGMCGL